MATCPVQWRTVHKGGDPKTDQEWGRLGPRAGIPKRQRPNCQKRYSRTSVDCINAKGRGPKTPWCRASTLARTAILLLELSQLQSVSRVPISFGEMVRGG